MPIAKQGSEGKQLDPIPAGVHQAVCYSVIDLGVQPSQNPKFPPHHKVQIGWEIPSEMIETEEGPKPRVIGKDFTLSLGKKANLLAALQSWRGRPFTEAELDGFEVADVIGANCLLNIIHKPSTDGTKVYANVLGIMPLPKGMPVLKPINHPMRFDIPKDGAISLPEDMPEFIKKKIMQSEEWVSRVSGGKAITETKKLEAGADPAIVGEGNTGVIEVPF